MRPVGWHSRFTVLHAVLAIAALASCYSYQVVPDAPAPRESVQMTAGGRDFTLLGRSRYDTAQVIRCTTTQVIGRFAAMRGDTLLLENAMAMNPRAGSSGHCGFRVDGAAYAAGGAAPTLALRRFSAPRTAILLAALGAVAVAVSTADWEYTSSTGGPGGCSGFVCLRP